MALAATDSIWMAKRIPDVEDGDAQVSGLNKDYGVVSLVAKPRVVIPLSRVRFSYDTPIKDC